MANSSHESLAKRLYLQQQTRNELYRQIDDIFYLRGGLPSGMPSWVQEVKSTEPRDAVMTATRVLSTLEPQFHVSPMLANDASRRWANDVELALKWNYTNAGRRTPTSPHWQLVMNSIRYAQPVVQVNYLPYQMKLAEADGKSVKNIKRAQRFGDFQFVVHDPANVYPLWSDYGLEAVLMVRLMTAEAFKSLWGDKATEDIDATVDKNGNPVWVSQFDLWELDRRIVWGRVGEGDRGTRQELVLEGAGAGTVVLDEENEMGFIPISVQRWGDGTSARSDQQVLPLLSGIAMAGHWEMLNVLFSLDASLAWKRAAQPIGVHSSATRTPPEMDYTEPVSTIELGPGESFDPLPPQSVDQHVASQYANFRNLIWQSTVARALQSLEFPGNTAYSTVNQVLQAATQSISPYRILAEAAISEAANIQLNWLSWWGESHDKDVNLYGYYPKKHEKYGNEIMIPWDEIDPEGLQVSVTLRPDVPLDRQQQINTAAVLYDRFPVPSSAALEEIGFENIEQLMEQREQENLELAYMSAENARPTKDVEFEYQVKMLQAKAQIDAQMMQMQAGIQQQQAAQQNAQQGAQQNPQQGGAQGGPPATNGPAMENNQGLGNNPAQGGQPPIQGAPGQALRGGG